MTEALDERLRRASVLTIGTASLLFTEARTRIAGLEADRDGAIEFLTWPDLEYSDKISRALSVLGGTDG